MSEKQGDKVRDKKHRVASMRQSSEEIAKSNAAVIISLGGSTLFEQNQAIEILRNNSKVLLHCVSSYPTEDALVNIDTINYIKKTHNLPTGFSSHEVGIDISVASSLLGAPFNVRHTLYLLK